MNDYSWGIAVGILVIAATIGRALARLIRAYATRVEGGRPASEGNISGPELEEVHRRLAELEERQDFTERLLTKQRDAERIAEPRD